MFLEPFLRRERIIAVRRGRVFTDRLGSAVLVLAVVAGCVGVWLWQGWDRGPIAVGLTFAGTTFGLVVLAQTIMAIALIGGHVAPAIAGERDRQSLDALLATRLSSARIVLGAMAAGLVRAANGLAATLPIVILVAFFLGIDARVVVGTEAGLLSTAVLVAALSIVASVESRTKVRAVAAAIGLFNMWLVLPCVLLILRMAFRLRVPRWSSEALLGMLDSSPLGVTASLVGLFPRPGGFVESVARMAALEVAGALGLTLWAVVRLRPASRSLHDAGGRPALFPVLRARWRRPRPPCGDDPVFWYSLHSTRATSWPDRVLEIAIELAILGSVAMGTLWFARPAFAELAAHGYAASPEARAPLPVSPPARATAGTSILPARGPAPGQAARRRFNIALRQTSMMFVVLYAVMVSGTAAAGVVQEYERKTWLGLIATPVTGGEILRGKMLASLWRVRWINVLLLGPWAVGLLTGAVHPLGFLLAVAGLAVSAGFFAATGVAVGLYTRGSQDAEALAVLLIVILLPLSGLAALLPGQASLVFGVGSTPLLTWIALVSYDDVQAVIRSGVLPQFANLGNLKPEGLGARLALAAWLLGTIAQAAVGIGVARAARRDFDALVGRPVRPSSPRMNPPLRPLEPDGPRNGRGRKIRIQKSSRRQRP